MVTASFSPPMNAMTRCPYPDRSNTRSRRCPSSRRQARRFAWRCISANSSLSPRRGSVARNDGAFDGRMLRSTRPSRAWAEKTNAEHRLFSYGVHQAKELLDPREWRSPEYYRPQILCSPDEQPPCWLSRFLFHSGNFCSAAIIVRT